jgi:hypothetical protein
VHLEIEYEKTIGKRYHVYFRCALQKNLHLYMQHLIFPEVIPQKLKSSNFPAVLNFLSKDYMSSDGDA